MFGKITETKADIALVITAVIWGAALLPIMASLKTNGVFTILFWRFFISGILMAIIALKFDKFFDKNAIKNGAILGITLFAGVTFQTVALKYAYSSTVSFIVSLYVILVPFLSYFFFKKKIFKSSYIGMAFGLVGLFMMQKNFSIANFGLGRGEMLAFMSALCLAFHITLMGYFTKKSELFTFLTAQFLVIAILCFIASYIFANGISPVIDFAFIRVMIITIFFSTLIGFSIEGMMLRYTTPIKAAIIFILKSVVAGFLGYFLGGENLTLVQITGAVIIILGILTSEIGSKIQKRI